MKLKVKQIIAKYAKVGDDYQHVEVTQGYTCNTYDDMQNLILSIVEASDGAVKFEISKEGDNE